MNYRKRRPSGDRDGGDHGDSSADGSPSYNSSGRQHKSATPPSPSSQQIPMRSSRRRSNSYDPIKVGYPNGEQKDHVNDRRPHDRALIRAINSELKMTKDHKSDPGKTLFIGRLNSITTEATLRMHFERFGDIRSLFLIKDVLSGESRRYAFIEYRRTKEADRAYSEAHNSIIDGRRILVDREHGRNTKEWKPRRFGGGYGGFKESGQIRFGGRSTEHHRGGPPPRSDNHHHRVGGGDRDRTRSMPYPSTRRFNGFQSHSLSSSSAHHHDHDDDRHHHNNNHHHTNHHHHHHHVSSPSPRSSRGSAMQYSSNGNNGGGDGGGSYRRHSSAAGPIRNRR